MTPYDIRLATVADAPAMLEIYAPFVRGTCVSFEYEVPTVEELAARVEQTLTRLPWLVDVADGAIRGYAYASPHRVRAAYQWTVDLSVYVDPQYHRRGIARALYDRLLAILRLQGFYGAVAGVGLPNPESQAFHLAYGFSLVGVFHSVGYKLGAWRDGARYELAIADRPEVPIPPRALSELQGTSAYKRLMGGCSGLDA